MNFIFYANKPSQNHCDYDYDGETIVEFEIDRERVVELWANCLLANKRLHSGEKGYKVLVLKNGRSVAGLISDNTLPPSVADELEQALHSMEKEADQLAVQWLEEINQEAKTEEELKKKNLEEECKKMRLAMYKTLKKEFEKE